MKKGKKQLNMEDKINKIKNLELIPTEYQILFDANNDWNKGNNSKMSSLERARMAELWLEYNHWDLQQSLKGAPLKEEIEVLYEDFSKQETDKKEIQGFIY
jgi:hypothetical protein